MSDAQAYPNRSDLRNPAAKMAATAAPGQTYGEAGAQIAAQRAVPMGESPVTNVPMPGSLGDLARPTERPMEPVTAGANAGPGPSFLETNIPVVTNTFDPVVEELQVLYKMFPNDDLANLLSSVQYGGL